MPSLVIFFDPRDISAQLIVPKLVAESCQHSAISDITLMSASHIPAFYKGRLRTVAGIIRRLMQIAMGSGRWETSLCLAAPDLRRLARATGVRLLEMADGDPNSAETMEHLDRLGPGKIGVNIYCRRFFKSELLGQFDTILNYHNGELPRFRGLRCSNWSIYMGHPSSAYSFHVMDAGFDTGAVLFTRAVPAHDSNTPAELEMKKALDAANHLDRIIPLLVDRAQGSIQRGIACNCNRAAYEIATVVPDPSLLTLDEWQLRLKSFLRMTTNISGRRFEVTGIRECRRPSALSFVTADQKLVVITGIRFWPARLLVLLQKRFGAA